MTQMPECDSCKKGDHQFHSVRLAYTCIGCSCEWMPADALDSKGT